ncbi:MAG: HAD family hydrolase [Gemmatimonadota bacterium]|nr:HAD family hydrolase [Gemmatimonadota bacterium]
MKDAPKAVFLDRDGTIIEDVHFIKSPSQVKLIPGAADAIRRISDAGSLVIVVTNQSGIARKLSTVRDYEAVRAHYEELLKQHGARIDRSYYCPHHPDVDGPCKCRKPGTQLFEQALADFSLAPDRVAYIGDRWRDVAAAKKLGGRGILVPSGMTTGGDHQRAKKERVRTMPNLGAAIDTLFGLTASKRAK